MLEDVGVQRVRHCGRGGGEREFVGMWLVGCCWSVVVWRLALTNTPAALGKGTAREPVAKPVRLSIRLVSHVRGTHLLAVEGAHEKCLARLPVLSGYIHHGHVPPGLLLTLAAHGVHGLALDVDHLQQLAPPDLVVLHSVHDLMVRPLACLGPHGIAPGLVRCPTGLALLLGARDLLGWLELRGLGL